MKKEDYFAKITLSINDYPFSKKVSNTISFKETESRVPKTLSWSGGSLDIGEISADTLKNLNSPFDKIEKELRVAEMKLGRIIDTNIKAYLEYHSLTEEDWNKNGRAEVKDNQWTIYYKDDVVCSYNITTVSEYI